MTIVLGNLLSLLIGTMLGMLIRSSPGALVAYFVYALLLPNVTERTGDQPALVPAACSRGSTSTSTRSRSSRGP